MTSQPENLFDNVPRQMPQELFQNLLTVASCRIERIVSFGHCSPVDFWYDQSESEWVLVLQGEAVLQFRDDETSLRLKAGDFVNSPAHRLHRVEWTQPDVATIWLAVFYRDERTE